jgi:hypothetical protein
MSRKIYEEDYALTIKPHAVLKTVDALLDEQPMESATPFVTRSMIVSALEFAIAYTTLCRTYHKKISRCVYIPL